MTALHHVAEYARNSETGGWRVRCSACSAWERFGSEEYVVNEFAVHDIELWQPVEPGAPAPAVPR